MADFAQLARVYDERFAGSFLPLHKCQSERVLCRAVEVPPEQNSAVVLVKARAVFELAFLEGLHDGRATTRVAELTQPKMTRADVSERTLLRARGKHTRAVDSSARGPALHPLASVLKVVLPSSDVSPRRFAGHGRGSAALCGPCGPASA
ncbi:hypothetical protein T492DRAFT_955689 [Pavlovales sp. CCMP2436]|nr:hypothetical protein T492DRAFT_955689 [Pavlovales sp. CCMP2436]